MLRVASIRRNSIESRTAEHIAYKERNTVTCVGGWGGSAYGDLRLRCRNRLNSNNRRVRFVVSSVILRCSVPILFVVSPPQPARRCYPFDRGGSRPSCLERKSRAWNSSGSCIFVRILVFCTVCRVFRRKKSASLNTIVCELTISVFFFRRLRHHASK